MIQTVSTAIDLDLITFLKAISDARMLRATRFPAWYLLLVVILGIISSCLSQLDLECFALRHHAALIEAPCIVLRRLIKKPAACGRMDQLH